MREFGYYWWIIGKNTWFQDNERITGASDRIMPPDDNETIR